MKKTVSLVSLLLLALLLLSLFPAALAEPEDDAPLIDEERLNQWIAEYRKAHDLEHDWQDVSIGFCYTATGDCWYYNADIFMYSASLYKVPVCMLISEKEAAGEIDQDTRIQGSTLAFLESSALINSNNDSGHVLISYLGGARASKCSDMSIGYTDLAESYFDQDFYVNSYYSARYMTQVMTTLYEGGEARFPHVIENLLQAQPNEYLNLTLKGKYDVAQKYGGYAEPNGYNNNHIAGIVYTPNPIIVVVMTRNVGDYQWRIAEIGAYLADYALELDELRAEREAAAAQTPAPTDPQSPAPAAENADPVAASEEPGAEAETAESPTAEAPAGKDARVVPLLALAGAAVLVVVVLADSARKRRLVTAGSRRRK